MVGGERGETEEEEMGGIKRYGERGGSSYTAHETKLCMYS